MEPEKAPKKKTIFDDPTMTPEKETELQAWLNKRPNIFTGGQHDEPKK